jgi:hypothetical protein
VSRPGLLLRHPGGRDPGHPRRQHDHDQAGGGQPGDQPLRTPRHPVCPPTLRRKAPRPAAGWVRSVSRYGREAARSPDQAGLRPDR